MQARACCSHSRALVLIAYKRRSTMKHERASVCMAGLCRWRSFRWCGLQCANVLWAVNQFCVRYQVRAAWIALWFVRTELELVFAWRARSQTSELRHKSLGHGDGRTEHGVGDRCVPLTGFTAVSFQICRCRALVASRDPAASSRMSQSQST